MSNCVHGQALSMGQVIEQREENPGSDLFHVPSLTNTKAVTEPLEILLFIPGYRTFDLPDDNLSHGNRSKFCYPSINKFAVIFKWYRHY